MGRAASRGPRLSGPIPSIDNRVRSDEIRAWIRADGSTAFTPEPGRYHLYVSLACPWAHRTLIVRHLKGLNRNISAAAVDPVRDDRGWTFRDGPGYSLDPVSGSAFLKEADLATNPAFQGRRPLKVDGRLFCTLIRFDAVYHGHFKCNLRQIADYPHLQGYLQDLYQIPGVASTVDFDHIKRHYYMTHPEINPTRIVPIGPHRDFSGPHGREQLA